MTAGQNSSASSAPQGHARRCFGTLILALWLFWLATSPVGAAAIRLAPIFNDGTFYPAQARVRPPDRVELVCDAVASPVTVRYA